MGDLQSFAALGDLCAGDTVDGGLGVVMTAGLA